MNNILYSISICSNIFPVHTASSILGMLSHMEDMCTMIHILYGQGHTELDEPNPHKALGQLHSISLPTERTRLFLHRHSEGQRMERARGLVTAARWHRGGRVWAQCVGTERGAAWSLPAPSASEEAQGLR